MPWKASTGPALLHGKLKGGGYRLTMPRQIILDVISETTDHLSAEEIYHKVHSAYPSIGLTTVYRTLELLVNMGLIHKFDFGDGRARYEIVEDPKSTRHHHHLVCTGCGRIIDYADFINEEIELLKKTEKSLSKKYNFSIHKHLIQFYGHCDKCKK
jgi:Fur family transcriptional regulator, ferric uptake regulator